MVAQAVKPRNEALCDSGLFENFLEYRCTPLGNIEDEATGRELSESEELTSSSLMSKLMMEQSAVAATNDGTSSSGPYKEGQEKKLKDAINSK